MNPIKDWPGIKIKHALEAAGYTQADIARECGVSVTQVNRVIHRGTVSDHVRRKIADRIGVAAPFIWPSYYLKDMVSSPCGHRNK